MQVNVRHAWQEYPAMIPFRCTFTASANIIRKTLNRKRSICLPQTSNYMIQQRILFPFRSNKTLSMLPHYMYLYTIEHVWSNAVYIIGIFALIICVDTRVEHMRSFVKEFPFNRHTCQTTCSTRCNRG